MTPAINLVARIDVPSDVELCAQAEMRQVLEALALKYGGRFRGVLTSGDVIQGIGESYGVAGPSSIVEAFDAPPW